MAEVRRVLIIDDETAIQESLEMFLREKGIEVFTAGAGAAGLEIFSRCHPLVVILDIRLPDIPGDQVLARLLEMDPEVKVIMITAYHDMETTIAAMRQGAYDYIHKPLDVDELDRAVSESLRITEAASSSMPLPPPERDSGVPHQIVGQTPAMQALFKTIGLLAGNRATVLIDGETGTGKELIARVIHESSVFGDQPYVTVDCTTLVESLFESELFGHERGAFTGAIEAKKGRLEMAGEGTIFFDEVGDLLLTLQAKLLRFLEYREFTRVGGARTYLSKARIIAATNRDLRGLVSQGRFRQDLLFRLQVFTISVPPLRDRREDLPALVHFFLSRINRELGTKVNRVEEKAMEVLRAHSWPGNVRELKNVLIKASLESRGSLLLAENLEKALTTFNPGQLAASGLSSLDDLEKQHIRRIMSETKGNLSAAARILHLSRPTLRQRLKTYGLDRDHSDQW